MQQRCCCLLYLVVLRESRNRKEQHSLDLDQSLSNRLHHAACFLKDLSFSFGRDKHALPGWPTVHASCREYFIPEEKIKVGDTMRQQTNQSGPQWIIQMYRNWWRAGFKKKKSRCYMTLNCGCRNWCNRARKFRSWIYKEKCISRIILLHFLLWKIAILKVIFENVCQGLLENKSKERAICIMSIKVLYKADWLGKVYINGYSVQ